MGLPLGDDEVLMLAAVPPTRPGTLESWREEEELLRCSIREEDIESESCAVESRILANLEYCATVRCEFAARLAGSVREKEGSCFEDLSSILRKSPIDSESSW